MNIKEIELAVQDLPSEEVFEFAQWFEDYSSRLWDEQIERDGESGRFKVLVERARSEHDSGQSRPL